MEPYSAVKSFITLSTGANVINLFLHNYATIYIISVKTLLKYINNDIDYHEKSFTTLGTGVNVIKLFLHNYATICIISVKTLLKYINNDIDYCEKSFIKLATVVNVIKLFLHNLWYYLHELSQNLIKIHP